MARTSYSHSDRELLARIGRSAGGKAGYKQLVRELGLGGGRERRLLIEQLTRMAARGDLRKLEDELWAIPRPTGSGKPAGHSGQTDADRNGRHTQQGALSVDRRNGREHLLSGRLELHRDGFGFVRLDPPKAGTPAGNGAGGDIFIPPPALHGAMHGDLVLIDEDPPGRDGRRSGRIARVLTRRNPTIVGIFHYARPSGRKSLGSADRNAFLEMRGNFVQPLDERLGGPVEIPEGEEVVAAGPGTPHRTLGEVSQRFHPSQEEGVEGAPDSRGPLEGLAVEVEVTSYPQPGRPARGRVVEILGPPDGFGVDVEIVIRKHAIPHSFPAHVLAEAEARAKETVETLDADALADREDFRGMPIVTIDGETAKDFDDAVLVRPLANGNTELQVHIADVGWYVHQGSALDVEARVRGTSVYFPDRAVPMLPHALSSGMCSLLPHEDRLVLSCVMEIDTAGEIAGYRVGEGIIRSARRMTYTSVQRILNASPASAAWNDRGSAKGLFSPEEAETDEKQIASGKKPKTDGGSRRGAVTPEPTAEDLVERERVGIEQPELPEAVDRMLELALRLNRKRARRGSIDFDLPEPVVEFDPDGNMKAIVRSERGWAHRLIEEFMLSANECVATWLTGQGISSIYRIHEMPDPKRIMEFEDTAAGFGQTLGVGTLPVKRMTMKSDRREVQRRGAQGRNGRPAPVHEVPASIPVTPQMYQRLVKRIQGKPEERILAYLMLRSLKQARYAEKNEGHFALASPCYTHFTSPIRRYPDLIVHRLLRTMLRKGADPRGGAIHSGDPQPWAVELARSQGRHAASVKRTGTVASLPLRRKPESVAATLPVVQPKEEFHRTKRPGRIGWTTDAGQPGSFAGDRGLAERVRHDERDDAEERRFAETMLAAPVETSELPLQEERAPDTLEPIPAGELADIAVESSQAERRAADAERELIEWKKMKFMADKIGNDFRGIILSVTKHGFFVELDELFIEGLVPLGSLSGDFYSFRDTDRAICGARTEHCFRAGDRVEVILDRIDRQQRRLQFALLPGTEPAGRSEGGSLRAGKSQAKKERAEARKAEKVAAKPKGPAKVKKSKAAKKKGKKKRDLL